MKTLKYNIPQALIISRLVVSVLIITLSFGQTNRWLIISLSIYAIISDVLDGIIARRLGISNENLRVMDTKTDTIFWFSCLFSICVNQNDFIISHLIPIGILVLSEIVIIIIGKIKFHARISFHTIISKFWALLLLIFFIDLMIDGKALYTFQAAFWYGMITQLEIITIAFLIKENQTDIPSLIQAIKYQQGKEIKRNKWFNG